MIDTAFSNIQKICFTKILEYLIIKEKKGIFKMAEKKTEIIVEDTFLFKSGLKEKLDLSDTDVKTFIRRCNAANSKEEDVLKKLIEALNKNTVKLKFEKIPVLSVVIPNAKDSKE